MRRALVVMVALVVLGCAPKPAAPPVTSSPATAPPPAPAAPAPVPAPPPPRQAATPPPAPAAPSSAPAPERSPTPVPPPAVTAAPAPAAPTVAPARKTLYVKTHLANLREATGTSGKILRVLRRGARLEVLETRNDWFRVRLEDGQEGWIAESVTSDTAP